MISTSASNALRNTACNAFLVVELDEELHFNIYRGQTLNGPFYGNLLKFPLAPYKSYCSTYQSACISRGCYGKYWETEKSSCQFGAASFPGTLTGNGSPRWKQRAIYDHFKDMLPLMVDDQSISRISVWDPLPSSGKLLGSVLCNPPVSKADQMSILALIVSRICP